MQKTLKLKFHGRVLDQLGFQTYQSRPASLAELVANAWDADATSVEITLPTSAGPASEIVVEDDGCGMTFEECQEKYLNIGYDRRNGNPKATTPGKRQVMGRKGIGKLAGFGIARKVVVETVSKETGESTRFELDMNRLGKGEYVGGEKPRGHRDGAQQENEREARDQGDPQEHVVQEEYFCRCAPGKPGKALPRPQDDHGL